MALIKAKTVADTRPINYDNPIAEKIQRRRYQILVHSLLYYELDFNLISDATWTSWAKELAKLQNDYPDIASQVIFAEAFKDFEGNTGFDLPFKDEQVINIASRLLNRERSQDSVLALRKLQGVRPTPAEFERYKKKSHTVKPAPVKKGGKPIEQKPRKGLFKLSRN